MTEQSAQGGLADGLFPLSMAMHLRVSVCVVDMWSVGCIFGELVRGTVLFPGIDRILLSLSQSGGVTISCRVVWMKAEDGIDFETKSEEKMRICGGPGS